MIRRPRVHNERHLAWIRTLPCLVCVDNISTEAAHIRYGCPEQQKRPTGLGERPDDKWTVPLCGRHHREQHASGERQWWLSQGIDPVKVADALWANTGQHEAGEAIVRDRQLERLRARRADVA